MASQLEKGRKIGQYEILEPLGKGGMASVYRAYQTNLDREVAIKVMAERYNTDPAFVERFRREARSIARLRHPNILTVYDAGNENGLLYLVMELIEGPTLKELLNNQPLALEQAEKIIGQMASALDYAHEAGIIHRDVKPSNVLIDKGERAVLADFGIVKMVNEENPDNLQLTNTGTGVGTPDYMSPEQAMGEHLDARSDEYSLAVMFYEMMTGRPPFSGDTPIAIVMGHVSKPLPLPTKYNPSISPAIEQVLLKGLAKRPEERYSTTGEFGAAVHEAFLHPYSGFSTLRIENASTPVNNMPTHVGLTDPEAEQLYLEARRLEQQNDFHAAFEVFTRLNSQYSNYRDVSTMLERYQVMGYGQEQTPGWQQMIGGTGTGSSNIANNNPAHATLLGQSQPSLLTGGNSNIIKTPVTAGKLGTNRQLAFIIGGIILALLMVVGVIVVFVVSKPNPPNPVANTATTQPVSIVVTTDAPAITTAIPTDNITTIDTTIMTDSPTPVDTTTPATPNTTTAATETTNDVLVMPASFQTYNSPTGKFTVEIPKNWFTSSTSDNSQTIDSIEPVNGADNQFTILRSIQNVTDQKAIDAFFASILTQPNFKITKTQDVVVDGTTAKLNIGTLVVGDVIMNIKLVALAKNGYLWIIGYQVLPADQVVFDKVFDKLLQTFKTT
jgi:serine/threonine-protein kinase